MKLYIPLTNIEPSFTELVFLEGVNVKLKFDWNARDNIWNLSIYDPDDNPILVGVKMVTNYELILQHPTLALPRGAMFLWDTEGKGEPAGYEDLGTRHKLVYVTSGEVDYAAFQ
jgi:hypothetical protein